MKAIIFGYGSAGQRHAANLRALRPDTELRIADPLKGMIAELHTPNDIDACVIASPTSEHAEQMMICSWALIPFYCEKPLLIPKEIGGFVSEILPQYITRPCAVGFQYRFSPSIPAITARLHLGSRLAFRARDSLVARYGPDVAGVMGAHAFDLACWLLGNPASVRIKSDGVRLAGTIEHERGTSSYDMDMDAGARVSECAVDGVTMPLTCDNSVYMDALGAWLAWVEGGARDKRTATLADGLAVAHVMAHVMEQVMNVQ